MKSRYQTPSTVFAIILSNDKQKVLLQQRQNTGYQDGAYDLATTGHVEQGESLPMALIRELKEEIGIDVKISDLKFVTMIHKHNLDTDNVYFNGYFLVTNYCGIPTVMEPYKNSGLSWWPISALLELLINDRKIALVNYQKGIPYLELGFQ